MVTTKTYTFSNVVGNHTIQAEFSNMTTVNIAAHDSSSTGCKIRYAITDTATTPSTGWTVIDPPTIAGTDISVAVGKYLHFEAYDFATDKTFRQWGIELPDEGESDTDNNNPSHYYISVNTQVNIYIYLNTVTHSISASCGTGGSMSYTTTDGASGTINAGDVRPVVVNNGSSATFTITATTGYRISRILVDGSPISLE